MKNEKNKARLTELLCASTANLYSTDGVPEAEKECIAFIAHPMGWTWKVYEAEPCESNSGDWRCFGRVDGFESELGYFYTDEILDAGAHVYTADEAMLFGF